jgi:putative cardiolipin synthase
MKPLLTVPPAPLFAPMAVMKRFPARAPGNAAVGAVDPFAHVPVGCLRFGRALLFAVATSALIAACARLPTDYPKAMSSTISDTAETRLGRAIDAELAKHPGVSAFRPLGSGLDAFVARLAFTEVAEKGIDLQYYLFHDDQAGRALMAYLLAAADRGVRVRLLLDDMDTGGRDEGLAALALHPNIAIRLFNPFPSRSLRYLNFFTHFGTVTRRMHNKAFIVDNQVAIVGGRNIGDEYFEAAEDMNFGDMDLLAFGPIVDAVSESFDLYWNSELAYPVAALGARGDPDFLAELRQYLDAEVGRMSDSAYARRLRQSNLAEELTHNALEFYHAPAQLLYDLPSKVLTEPEDRSTHLGPELAELLRSADKWLIAISPYFVPGDRGSDLLTGLAARGVEVTVVTNSLASTDVPAVHAGYARYRRELLEAGVRLYEIRPSPGIGEEESRRFGSSQSSLHAKTFAIDGSEVLVGSMNMDPRSDLLNTEMGLVIQSPELAAQLLAWRRTELADHAWRLVLEEDTGRSGGSPRLRWIGRNNGEEFVVDGSEPEAGFWRRVSAALLRLLPIEQQL